MAFLWVCVLNLKYLIITSLDAMEFFLDDLPNTENVIQ